MHSTSQDPDKFRRYRERLKAKGLRQIHLWVPDTASPRFQKELRRQLAHWSRPARKIAKPWISLRRQRIGRIDAPRRYRDRRGSWSVR
jgi:hypothetical protein